MTATDALSRLGLRSGYTVKDLKRAYRNAALKNHPDKGGDKREMQLDTDAYNLLLKRSGSGRSTDYDKERKRRRDEHSALLALLKKRINLKAFEEHLKQTLGADYTASIEEKFYPRSKHLFSIKLNLIEDGGKNRFTITYSIESDAGGLGTGESTSDIPIRVFGTGLLNNRKYKLYERNAWRNSARMASEATDPAKLLPSSKLKKHLAKKRKLAKRDFYTLLRPMNDGIQSGDDFWIKSEKIKDSNIAVRRLTFRREGFYTVTLFTKEGRSYKPRRDVRPITLAEDESTMEIFRKLPTLTLDQLKKLAEDLRTKK